ncbi:MAG: UvrD-helicase domain-containing protein [Bacteroidota bacterium]
MEKTFSIYRSSAGSGKTRTLAKEYLKLALRYKNDYFKYILAVTFTNKATQEMKDRILAYLDKFANGKENDLSKELQDELKFDASTFQMHAHEVQSRILHEYNLFSISTIDAFFQKVIRSFTREAGLAGDYRLEVEQEPVLEEVINNLIDELGTNQELTQWVVDYANENLENDRPWDTRRSLLEFGNEIFKEEFKVIESEVNTSTAQKDFFKNLLADLKKKKYEFTGLVKAKSIQALEVFHQHGLEKSDFKYGGGIYNFFTKFSKITSVKDFDETAKGKRSENEFQNSSNWPDKDTTHRAIVLKLASEKLIPLLNEILAYRNKNFRQALSAEIALSNFYAFGLIADISRKLKDYKEENGIMLLADAPRFLNGVIQDSDTPFIYEKVGSFYRNYLIDEFQDTSGLQWKNFFPLLTNGLDQGYPSMVVGDVKQAVYRWRGGDLKLLQSEIEQRIGKERVYTKELQQNFRSAREIVTFNNALFETSATIVTGDTGKSITSEAYRDVPQLVSKEVQGFVHVSFLEGEADESWKELALNQIPVYLEKLQLLGASLKDIAILVRTNDEGQGIVARLLDFKNSGQANPNYRYDVVSNESLRLDGASTVNLLISSLQYLHNPEDGIARAHLGYELARLHDPGKDFNEVFMGANQATFESTLPSAFTSQKISLKKLPLFELTETLIEIFGLGKVVGELTYLQTFQNLVLDFTNRERNDLGAFLEWWEENKSKKSIQVSGDVDAVQLMTLHKSKGLQFKYVIIPFCSWSLDHEGNKSPRLWVTSDESPLDKAGYLPIKYSSALKETAFAEYYEEERSRCYLDNLNLLYVAFTRAEHGMIVMAPVNYGKTVAKLLAESMTTSDVLNPKWNKVTQEWKSGEWSLSESSGKKDKNPAIALKFYPSTPWRDKLVIKQTARGYFGPDDNPVFEKVKYGIHLHAVLSRIKYADELEGVIQQIIFDGLMTRDEKPMIEKLIGELLRNEVIASWFGRDWDVRTEVPILLPARLPEAPGRQGSGDSRIDRLMLKEDKSVVVDFKTGEPKKEDQKQVAEYMEILKKMDFPELEGYLLYIKTGDVVSVPPGKSSIGKTKDKKQLGLGF